MIKPLTTMQQVNRRKQAGDLLLCTCEGFPRAHVEAIRYGQGAFQVKLIGSDEWLTPVRVWAEPVSNTPTLFNM